MWQWFVVQNFRCFSSLRLQPLARVNLIAGKNNTGKTALLEAIHLHSYPQDCELPFRISSLRGEDDGQRINEAMASWLFYDRRPAYGIGFTSANDQGAIRTQQIALGDGAAIRQRFPATGKFVQGSFLEEEWKTDRTRIVLQSEERSQEHWAVGVLVEKGLASISNRAAWNGPSAFLSSWRHFPEEEVRAFSELEVANRQDELLPSLQLLEPRLKRLSLILLADRPVLHADIGLSQLVPMTLMGEGIRRLLSILSAILCTGSGKVLIDEIENGLHHSLMKEVWQAIANAARQANVQVFATTHSYECIQAAHEAFAQSDPYDLRLHRLARVNEEVRVGTYDKETLGTAMEQFMEVR